MANQVGAISPDQEGMCNLTAVAIDRDKNSQHAVRWAVENLELKDKFIILVHVVSTQRNLHHQDVEPRPPTHTELQQLFLPYRGFCARKGIRAKEVTLHDLDIASALSEFISANSIKTIVLGASHRGAIARAFRNADVPTSVGKYAPDSCTVFAISKGRMLKIKTAIEPILETNAKTNSGLVMSPDNCDNCAGSPVFLRQGSYQNSYSDQSTPTGLTRPRRSLDYTSNSRQSSLENSRRSLEYGRSTPTSSNTPSPTNISLDSTPFTSHSNSPDHKAPNFALMQSSNFVNLRGRALDSMPHFLSGSSDPSEEQSYQSDLSYELMDHSKLSDASGSSTASAAELEDELRRMKLELKQILELYNVACQEAESAKEKVREIIKWDTEKASRLAEAKHVHDAALAVVEREKSKCKAAVDIAHRAQHIAELESEKRKRAECKFQHESEEKQKAMDALARCGVRCRRYSIEEIEAATNYFSPSDKIGEGSYGPVYKGMIDHTPVAIKVLRSDISEGHKQFQQEVEVLSRMRHPNMVILLGACPEYGCLVYEHMDNGSLEDRLLRTPPLPWPSRFRIAAEVATALNFLHQTKPEPLVHRDLKPANILLDRNHIAKISDVGLARLVPPPDPSTSATQYRHTAAAGTFCYIDPEYQQTGMLGTKSDVYSLGVLLLQLITARPPMGLTHLVGTAIEEGRFGDVLDPAVDKWPIEEALCLARLALGCCELRRRDRPDLDRVVLPELERLRDVGRQERGSSFETEPEF
ncbi:kinase family protein [Striga asiatica]|uniref:RING-type E3 ubiquitin transferase n=1 Tax=Striga asiatica TaxID=4170 RepID=A0A5A7QIV3_STRAF|nr:kinase family protein [Striga asiatica]